MATLGWISSPTCRPSNTITKTSYLNAQMHRAQCSLQPPPPPSPWLLLRSTKTAYKMYSLAEGRVLTLNKSKDDVIPEKGLLVGSSHGWLAFFDKNSQHVFLSNPISGGHIKLPRSPYPWPCRVILSCAPGDDEKCYAVSTKPALAFCQVGVSDEWTVFDIPILYDDFTYCSTRKVFSFITPSKFEFDPYGVRVVVLHDDIGHVEEHQIDYWEISNEEEVMMRPVDSTWFWALEGPPHSWKENEDVELLTKRCSQKLHLVHYHALPLPLIVVQFKMLYGMTRGFLVLQIDEGAGIIKVVEDLKGLAIFVGMSHSFAIPVPDTGTILKPNSIYFTPSTSLLDGFISKDVGIFDYHNKTFSPCYYNNLETDHHHHANFYNGPHPMWFTPH
ncbi:hypothetical protein OROMI_031007 [Orobanche minor]